MIPSISNEPNYTIPPKQSLYPFDIDNYSSSQPTGIKSVITRQMPKIQENPPEVVYNPLPPKEKFKVGTFEREYPSFKPVDRKDITMVGISPKETEQRKQYEDMLLQLCAEKIIQQRKQTDIPIPMQQEQLPPSQQEIEHQNRVEKVLDQLLGEKLAQAKKQAMKKKQKITSSYPNENSSDINTSNTIQKVNVCEYVSSSQNQNQQPQTQMFERLMTNLIDKFGGIEKALKELTLIKNNQQPQNVNEPNASILKAGIQDVLCERYSMGKLHPNSNLFTSSVPCPHFPGRGFRVESCCGFGKKELRQMLSDISRANISIRNFPSTVVELRRKLKLAEGGETYLFASTMADGKHVLIRCVK
jgi:hypothetical protein